MAYEVYKAYTVKMAVNVICYHYEGTFRKALQTFRIADGKIHLGIIQNAFCKVRPRFGPLLPHVIVELIYVVYASELKGQREKNLPRFSFENGGEFYGIFRGYDLHLALVLLNGILLVEILEVLEETYNIGCKDCKCRSYGNVIEQTHLEVVVEDGDGFFPL